MNFSFFVQDLAAMRPMIFDCAAIMVIGAIIMFMCYIRHDRSWIARVSLWMFVTGVIPLFFLVVTGFLNDQHSRTSQSLQRSYY